MTFQAFTADPMRNIKNGSEQLSRRRLLGSGAALASTTLLPKAAAAAAVRAMSDPVRLGLIGDLHHDVMHDGFDRLHTFVESMQPEEVDALIQLGDFACPKDGDQEVIELINRSHRSVLHVIGNHDTDDGHTKPECVARWGMPSRYYTQRVGDLNVIVLDGNDQGSPTHGGGYPSYIGDEQFHWLGDQLKQLDPPIVVLSHQPLAGSAAIDNAASVRELLAAASDKVVLAINGHTHIDAVVRVGGINYLHINSAAYQWVGGAHRHASFAAEVHSRHPWIEYTCPYREPLFASLTIDPRSQMITVEGRASEWVGPSPSELKASIGEGLTHGVEVAPMIRDRKLTW